MLRFLGYWLGFAYLRLPLPISVFSLLTFFSPTPAPNPTTAWGGIRWCCILLTFGTKCWCWHFTRFYRVLMMILSWPYSPTIDAYVLCNSHTCTIVCVNTCLIAAEIIRYGWYVGFGYGVVCVYLEVCDRLSKLSKLSVVKSLWRHGWLLRLLIPLLNGLYIWRRYVRSHLRWTEEHRLSLCHMSKEKWLWLWLFRRLVVLFDSTNDLWTTEKVTEQIHSLITLFFFVVAGHDKSTIDLGQVRLPGGSNRLLFYLFLRTLGWGFSFFISASKSVSLKFHDICFLLWLFTVQRTNFEGDAGVDILRVNITYVTSWPLPVFWTAIISIQIVLSLWEIVEQRREGSRRKVY